MRSEQPRGSPAWPARRESRLGVPVEVVGWPFRGDGRMPGTGRSRFCVGGGGEVVDEAGEATETGGPRVLTITWRLRKLAMVDGDDG